MSFMPSELPTIWSPMLSTIMMRHFFVDESNVEYDSNLNAIAGLPSPIMPLNESCDQKPPRSAFDVIVPVNFMSLPSMPVEVPVHFHVPVIDLTMSVTSCAGFGISIAGAAGAAGAGLVASPANASPETPIIVTSTIENLDMGNLLFEKCAHYTQTIDPRTFWGRV